MARAQFLLHQITKNYGVEMLFDNTTLFKAAPFLPLFMSIPLFSTILNAWHDFR